MPAENRRIVDGVTFIRTRNLAEQARRRNQARGDLFPHPWSVNSPKRARPKDLLDRVSDLPIRPTPYMDVGQDDGEHFGSTNDAWQ